MILITNEDEIHFDDRDVDGIVDIESTVSAEDIDYIVGTVDIVNIVDIEDIECIENIENIENTEDIECIVDTVGIVDIVDIEDNNDHNYCFGYSCDSNYIYLI